jgi:isopenicillin N synthase-like dioxygenase
VAGPGGRRDFSVPVIDISNFDTGDRDTRASVARLVDDTFTLSGFLALVGHGIPEAVVRDARSALFAFYEQPLDEKLRWQATGQSRGYFPYGSIASARYGNNPDAPPDIMESFAVGAFQPPPWAHELVPANFEGENIWPDQPSDLRAALERYFLAVERLGWSLLRLCASALRMPEDFFIPAHTPYNGIMRMNFYPRQTEEPAPGQIRIGAHTDSGGFTILKADPSSRGLQILDLDGNWHAVDPPADSFVINLGALVEAWTNGRWRATLHRVVNPPTPEDNRGRLSVAYFINPDPAYVCTCIPTCLDPGARPSHEPFTAGDFRKQRMAGQVATPTRK